MTSVLLFLLLHERVLEKVFSAQYLQVVFAGVDDPVDLQVRRCRQDVVHVGQAQAEAGGVGEIEDVADAGGGNARQDDLGLGNRNKNDWLFEIKELLNSAAPATALERRRSRR